MKLLFINGHLNTGGVEKSLLDILRHLDYTKYEVELLLLEELGDYASFLPPQVQINLCCLKNTYGSLVKSLLNCIRNRDWFCFKMRLIFLIMKFWGQDKISLAKNMLTKRKYYDCVIGYRSGICTLIASYAINAKRRITWWHHGTVNVEYGSYLHEVANCDIIVAVSDGIHKMLVETMPLLSPKIITIPNMVDVLELQSQAMLFNPYKEESMLHIVSLGRLVSEKHFQNAIQAAKQLKSIGIPFQWHLVGEGILHDTLLQYAKDLDVADCFIFEGNQPNPYPYLKHADLFVHPSYVESQGLVVLEAMALGIPCVVTKSLGVCEFIEDGYNAFLTEQNSASLAEKVVGILSNREMLINICTHTSCPNRYLPQNVLKKFDAMLEESM